MNNYQRPPYGRAPQFGPDAVRPLPPQAYAAPRPKRVALRNLVIILGFPLVFFMGVVLGVGGDGATQAAAPASTATTTMTTTVTAPASTVTAPPTTVTASPETTPTVTETVEVTVTAQAPAPAPEVAPAPAPQPEAPIPAPAPQPAPNYVAPVYYQNCAAARAAGAAPVYAGEPGYGPHLDRDGDGKGCE